MHLQQQVLPSKRLILTFNISSLPAINKAAYLSWIVRSYISNSLRCFQCQRTVMLKLPVVAPLPGHAIQKSAMTVNLVAKMNVVPTVKMTHNIFHFLCNFEPSNEIRFWRLKQLKFFFTLKSTNKWHPDTRLFGFHILF